MANFNYFPDVDSLKGHCSSVQFTLYGHNLKRLALSTEFSESICILWRVYGGSCVPLCLKADGTWVGSVGYVPLQILAAIESKHYPSNDLLLEDTKNGKAKKLKRKLLWNSREEYQNFTLEDFWKHVYQEKYRQLAGPYWQKKRNKAALKEHEKRVKKMYQEWHHSKWQNNMDGLARELESF